MNSLELLKKAINSPNNDELLQQVKEESSNIIEALDEDEIDFSNEEIEQLESNYKWLNDVFDALNVPVSENLEEESIHKSLQKFKSGEDKNIEFEFFKLLVSLPDNFSVWKLWFNDSDIVDRTYADYLRKQTVTMSDNNLVKDLFTYGLNPATFFEVFRGIVLLLNRTLRNSIKSCDVLPNEKQTVTRNHHLEKINRVVILLNDQQSNPENYPVISFALLKAQICNSSQLPLHTLTNLLNWIIKVAQYKNDIFNGYSVEWVEEDNAIQLTKQCQK